MQEKQTHNLGQLNRNGKLRPSLPSPPPSSHTHTHQFNDVKMTRFALRANSSLMFFFFFFFFGGGGGGGGGVISFFITSKIAISPSPPEFSKTALSIENTHSGWQQDGILTHVFFEHLRVF